MKLEEAQEICNDLLKIRGQLSRHFLKLVVCGSIRRHCDVVGDIDLVGIEKPNAFGEPSLSQRINLIDPTGSHEAQELGKQGAARFLDGGKIKRFKYRNIMIDLYLADEKTFGTLVLIRTGSKEHNIRLTTLAISRNMKLKAGGEGLVDRNKESMVYDNTEDGILMKLLGRVPGPEQRN